MGARIEPVFSAEVQLAGWSQTHNGGIKIVLWLSDDSELEVFRAMTCRKGGTAGQRLMCVMVEIGDDELPKSQGKPHTPLFTSAIMLCKDARFQEFVFSVGASVQDGSGPEEVAAVHIKEFCGVESRKKLDSDPEAAAMFSRLMSLYRDWRTES